MKSFYSILKLSPNIATEDSVAVGLLLFENGKFSYYFSSRKKKIAQNLLPDNSIDLNFILNQVRENCDAINRNPNQVSLFERYDTLTGVSYFDYLSNYLNGVLQLSVPNVLLTPLGTKGFGELVKLFFKEDPIKERKKESKFEIANALVNKKLIEKVKNNVHTDYKFEPKHFPTIYFNFNIDCIGLNGSLIGAKSLSFDRSLQSLDRDLSHYFTLISTLSAKFNKTLLPSNFYLLSQEPLLVGSKEHKLWETIRLNELITVIDPEESETVANLILDKRATKFLKITE